jgi:tRNA A37 threonylcarbamoyladenosine dehydratase
MSTNPIFHRSALLLGDEVMSKLSDARVIIFGIGGVGSWSAESLIRSGIGHLTIVDNDVICITNVNRQLQATSKNVGKVKVDELKKHLLNLNPDADITALQQKYDESTKGEFDLSSYDYVIDAIDTLACKVELIANSLNSEATLFSALGAACKIDVTQIQVSSIWESNSCKLAKLVRKRLRQRKVEGDFLCVWSEELLPSMEVESACGTDKCFCPKKGVSEKDGENRDAIQSDDWCSKKAVINGSMAHITGTFGFTLAGLIIQDIIKINSN